MKIFAEKRLNEAVAPPDPPDDRQLLGLRFARRIRLPRARWGLGDVLPVAADVSVATCLWRLVAIAGRLVFCLATLAWRWAAKALDPLRRKFTT